MSGSPCPHRLLAGQSDSPAPPEAPRPPPTLGASTTRLIPQGVPVALAALAGWVESCIAAQVSSHRLPHTVPGRCASCLLFHPHAAPEAAVHHPLHGAAGDALNELSIQGCLYSFPEIKLRGEGRGQVHNAFLIKCSKKWRKMQRVFMMHTLIEG